MPTHVPGVLRQTKADKHYSTVIPRLLQLVEQGYNQTECADILNREGFTTLDGGKFHQVAVHRLIKRARKAQAQGKLTPTATGAALAKQANIEARQPSVDDMFAAINSKQDEAFEMMKAYHTPDISGTN